MTVHRLASYLADGLCPMTDREYADRVDRSCSIREAYAALGRVKNPMQNACHYASTYGIRSRIGGTPRGEAPASGLVRVSR